MRLGSCGKGLVISENVFIDNPKCIHLGEHVWLDRNVVLMAGQVDEKMQIDRRGVFEEELEGKIFIGSFSHLGIGTILQGNGGIRAGKYFTTSAHCRIYTNSNSPSDCRQGTMHHGQYKPSCIMTQVVIQDNVWLALSVTVLGGKIGANSFIKPNAVVLEDVEENSVADGFPAMRIKNRFEKE